MWSIWSEWKGLTMGARQGREGDIRMAAVSGDHASSLYTDENPHKERTAQAEWVVSPVSLIQSF